MLWGLPREQLFDIINCIGISNFLKCMAFKALRAPRVSVKLPDGQVVLMDVSQIPNVLLNIAHIYYYGDYELDPQFKPDRGWTVIDVGAYIGIYALRASKLVGPQGLVIALEPHPINFNLLKLNIELNNAKNILALPYALMPMKCIKKLFSPKYRANASMIRSYAELWSQEVSEVEVKCITLRDLIKALKIDSIDLLKMDIEGLEKAILTSSSDVLSYIKRLVVEVHLDACDVEEIEEILRQHGYYVKTKIDALAPNQAFITAMQRTIQ